MRNVASLFAGVFCAALAVASACAQQPQARRVVGEITSVSGATLVVRDGEADLKVTVTDNVVVFGVVKRTLADIKPGAFVGIGAVPQPDGMQRAIRIAIFPQGPRPNEGHRPWAGAPHGTMTNAEVDTSIAAVEGQVLRVKYKDGEQRVMVTADTVILGSLPGDRSELKAGAHVLIVQAVPKPDGTFEAARINVGRGGVRPM